MARVTEVGPTETSNYQEMADAVHRVAGARINDPETVDDVVQETLARVIEAKKPLVGQARIGYAIVVARNLVADIARHNQRLIRNQHRLIDLRDPEHPEEVVLRGEERQALETALKRVPDADRHAFIAHEVLDVATARIARDTGSTPGGVATRLARTRANLRVEYLLALRAVDLPTAKCRPVLIALSAGDARRQSALNSGRHLLECSTCASLSPALLERRRALAALLPVAALARFPAAFKSWMGTTAGKAVGATAVVATGASIVVANLGGDSQPRPEPAPPIVTVSGEKAVLPSDLGQYVGERVRADDASVQRVPVDEGFWVASGRETVVWVRLQARGESSVEIDQGDTIDFSGVVRPNPPGFPADQGLRGTDAERLRAHGHHVVVAATDVRIVRN